MIEYAHILTFPVETLITRLESDSELIAFLTLTYPIKIQIKLSSSEFLPYNVLE